MAEKTMTQLETLTKHFSRKKTITSSEARDRYGIQSLSRRILDLEENGLQFNRVPFTTEGKRMVKYQIVRAA